MRRREERRGRNQLGNGWREKGGRRKEEVGRNRRIGGRYGLSFFVNNEGG